MLRSRLVFLIYLCLEIGLVSLFVLLIFQRHLHTTDFVKPKIDFSSQITNELKNVSTSTKKVALTFDDGPSFETLKILNILKQENIHATFFVVGKFAEMHPEILKKEVDYGNQIGNHSYDHSKFLAKIGSAELLANIQKNQNVIENLVGGQPKIFRPPYGNLSNRMIQTLEKAGYKIVLWNVDPRDWDIKNNPAGIEKNIEDNVKNNSIILLHDGKSNYVGNDSKKLTDENTEVILQDLILKLKGEGYEFVTLDELYK